MRLSCVSIALCGLIATAVSQSLDQSALLAAQSQYASYVQGIDGTASASLTFASLDSTETYTPPMSSPVAQTTSTVWLASDGSTVSASTYVPAPTSSTSSGLSSSARLGLGLGLSLGGGLLVVAAAALFMCVDPHADLTRAVVVNASANVCASLLVPSVFVG